jgi:hypothetical protein
MASPMPTTCSTSDSSGRRVDRTWRPCTGGAPALPPRAPASSDADVRALHSPSPPLCSLSLATPWLSPSSLQSRTASAMAAAMGAPRSPLFLLHPTILHRADRVSTFLTPHRTSRGPHQAGSAFAASCRRSAGRRVSGHRGRTSSSHRDVSHPRP